MGVGVDENTQPIPSASSSAVVGGSRRSGRELISTAVPWSRQAVNTFSASNSIPGEAAITVNKASRCSARAHRRERIVTALDHSPRHRRASIDSLECTLATTTSRRSRNRVPDPATRRPGCRPRCRQVRIGAHRSPALVDDVELLSQPLGRQPVGDRQAWRMVRQRAVLVPDSLPRASSRRSAPNRPTNSSARAGRPAVLRRSRRRRNPWRWNVIRQERPAPAGDRLAITFAVLGPMPGSDCQLAGGAVAFPFGLRQPLDNVGGVAVGHHAPRVFRARSL